jgi:hypothetical protein
MGAMHPDWVLSCGSAGALDTSRQAGSSNLTKASAVFTATDGRQVSAFQKHRQHTRLHRSQMKT